MFILKIVAPTPFLIRLFFFLILLKFYLNSSKIWWLIIPKPSTYVAWIFWNLRISRSCACLLHAFCLMGSGLQNSYIKQSVREILKLLINSHDARDCFWLTSVRKAKIMQLVVSSMKCIYRIHFKNTFFWSWKKYLRFDGKWTLHFWKLDKKQMLHTSMVSISKLWIMEINLDNCYW